MILYRTAVVVLALSEHNVIVASKQFRFPYMSFPGFFRLLLACISIFRRNILTMMGESVYSNRFLVFLVSVIFTIQPIIIFFIRMTGQSRRRGLSGGG